MRCNFLNDNWEVSGNELKKFEKELKNLDTHTFVKKIPMNQCGFLHVSGSENELAAVQLNPDDLLKEHKTAVYMPKSYVNKTQFTKAGYVKSVLDEALTNGLFLTETKKFPKPRISSMVENGEYAPVSESAMASIASRIRVSGSGYTSDPLIRDLLIASNFNSEKQVSLVIRKNSKMQKVFAIMSGKYALIPQSLIQNVIHGVISEAEYDLGKTECASWNINHSTTRIYLEFPDAAEELKKEYDMEDSFIPGLLIETSDTGDSSFRMKGFYRIEDTGSIIYMEEEFSRIHSGSVDESEILKAARETIFPKYTYYPARLMDLMVIDLTNDEMSDREKIKKMTKVYHKVSREIGLVKALGKTKEKALIDELIASVNPAIDYTAYDVVMDFFTLDTYLDEKSKTAKETIAKTAAEAIKIDFEQVAKI